LTVHPKIHSQDENSDGDTMVHQHKYESEEFSIPPAVDIGFSGYLRVLFDQINLICMSSKLSY